MDPEYKVGATNIFVSKDDKKVEGIKTCQKYSKLEEYNTSKVPLSRTLCPNHRIDVACKNNPRRAKFSSTKFKICISKFLICEISQYE